MEEDVLNALKSRAAYLPGGFDRDGKTIMIINVNNDLQLWNKKCLELCVNYLKRSLRTEILKTGLVVIVDAQKCLNRLSKAQSRSIVALFSDIPVNIYLVRPEGFWEKHVETCAKSQIKGEPMIVSKLRLLKYFKIDELPVELGGTLVYNHELWLDNRVNFEDYRIKYEQILNDLENLHVVFLDHKSMRPSEADQELKSCAQLYANIQNRVEFIIEMGNRLVTRIADGYNRLLLHHHPSHSNNKNNNNNNDNETILNHWTITITTNSNNNLIHNRMPQDLVVIKTRIELMLNKIEKKQTDIRLAWNDLERSVQETRELFALEEGVAFVTNWILGTAEIMLNRKQLVGCDISTSEELRRYHENFEMECRETYGFYAELLYKIDTYPLNKESFAYKDLISQKDFMDFVCRSFATRLERRRNILITALRFFRLVTEYFDKTGVVFESLVMGGGGGGGNCNNKIEDFDLAASNLQKLKDSQLSLENVERELIKEGEKLSDMLSMPVKDAMGRDLCIDYSDDIANIRDILDATIARRNIFIDSVELQKLTLEQVAHIHTYELDAQMAIKWMDDLYNVMIKCHSHVGCNIHEIQVQKDDLQTFQETGKSIYNYGWQLIEASQALRSSSKLDTEICKTMCNQLKTTWTYLQAISQEHMTRLRVSAVFHRSVDEYCNKLQFLRGAVSAIGDIEEPERRRNRLRKYLSLRERLLVEVGRMVRLGRLLKTRLKEPFILDDTNNNNSSDTTTMINENNVNGGSNIVRPTGGNAIACDVISNKLTEIAGVAESLDSTLRDIQQDFDLFETNSSSSEKKFEDNRNGSVDEWSSSVRSTEDESFATASDGNFTPQSRSSSYHTASYLSSDKNSFDNSDIDECTEIDLDAPLFPIQFNRASANASFDSSDHSFLSAQQSLTNSPQSVQLSLNEMSPYRDICEKAIHTNYNNHQNMSNDIQNDDNDDDDQNVNENDGNNSRSITPTPSTNPIKMTNNIISTHTSITHNYNNNNNNNNNNNYNNNNDSDNETITNGTDNHRKPSDSTEIEVRVCDNNNKSTNINQNWGNRYYQNTTVAKQTIKGFL